jgi:hypothetical protein
LITRTTLLYLFGERWVPGDKSVRGVHVPTGGKVHTETLVEGLLHAALWSLREDGLAELELVRPAGSGRVVEMMGPSNVRVAMRPADRPGLEGAFLDSYAKGDPDLRAVIRRISAVGGYPWKWPAKRGAEEAIAAGIAERQGGLFRKRPVANAAALAELEPRYEEVAAAWDAFKSTEEQLSAAIQEDCVAAIAFHQRG